MEGNVLQFRKDSEIYRKLARERNEAGDYIGALSCLFSAMEVAPESLDVIMDIADTYADMNLWELSNKYWYIYLDRVPEKKAGVAYVELAVNHFYMKKYWVSGYFFHKKVGVDEYIDPETIDPEISEYFSDMASETEINIVYPKPKINVERLVKLAERAIAEDNFVRAIDIYERIPESERDEELSGSIAFAYFMDDQDDKVIAECKRSLEKNGENVTAYCNLSALYVSKKNYEKGGYYYNKALECCKDLKKYAHKLVCAAMDNGDDVNAEKFCAILIADGNYELLPRIIRGQALINTQRYNEAFEQFSDALKIDPFNTIVLYYKDLSERLMSDDKRAKRLLPLAFTTDLPDMEKSVYKRAINDYVCEGKVSPAREKYLREVSKYGESSDDPLIAKAVFMFRPTGKVYKKFGEHELKKAFRMLLDPAVSIGVKSSLVQMIVAAGVKRRFGVVMGVDRVSIKPKKTIFDSAPDGTAYLAAYAECLVCYAMSGLKCEEHICRSLEYIYLNYKDLAEFMDLGPLELAAVAAMMETSENSPRLAEAMILFGADGDRVKNFLKKAGHYSGGGEREFAENKVKKGNGND